IILAGFSALIIFSIFFASDTIFGQIVLTVLRGFFGTGAYIFPFGVILAVIGFFVSKDRENSGYKGILCCILFGVVVSLLHILIYEAEDAFTLEAITGGFTETNYVGGGLIGGFFGGGSLVLFKKAGSVIIFVTLTIALVVLISGKSILNIFSGIARFVTETLMGGIYTDEYEDEYYDDYGEYEDFDAYEEEYEVYEKPVPKPKKQKPAPKLVQEDVSYYEKLRKEKSYKDAKFINLKENKGEGEKKARPDLMAGRITRGIHTGEAPVYTPKPVEKEPSAMPDFLKKEKPLRRRQTSEYVPEFLRNKNTKTYDEPEEPQYEEYEGSDEYYEPETDENLIIEETEPAVENIVVNRGSGSLITVEAVEDIDETEPDIDDGEDEAGSLQEEEQEITDEETYVSESETADEKPRNDIRKTEDIPPWETPEETAQNQSTGVNGTGTVRVIEGDAATVSRIQTKKAGYSYPKLSFLNKNPDLMKPGNKDELIKNSHILEDTLKSFKVDATVVEVSQGPTITRYELVPAVGTKVKSIASLDKDLAMRLAAENIIIEAPIPGKTVVGIEVPNENPSLVYFSEVVASKKFQASKSKLTFALGKDVAGNVIVRDIAKAPHFLIAGATNSGKSVCINTLINCILYKATPDEVRLIMVDPKMVELNVYNGIPHLLIPVVTEAQKASAALNWACTEMMRRYKLCADVGVRNLDEYNEYLTKQGEKPLYKIVIIIDELADLMLVAKKEVEGHIQRLTQLARAAGIHLIVATQRPSSDVITGVIKSNIPSRIAFSVAQAINSRIILDESGAEKLIGRGDMLLKTVEMDRTLRVQGAFISNDEIKRVVDHIKTDEPNYDREIMKSIENPETEGDISGHMGSSNGSDELINDVIAYVVKSKKASTSLIQRQFQIGYNRAARIIDELEERGIVGPENGSKPRAVFMDKEEWKEYSQRQRNYI
ncbi:MAG: DNA translocase FtsK, partial [Clostridiales bacterium]|nr:DNA translocase FtsK [Clostridiales bacterium]